MQKLYTLSLLVFFIGSSGISYTAEQNLAVMAPEHAAQVRTWRATWANALNHSIIHEQKLQQARTIFFNVMHDVYSRCTLSSELLYNLRDRQHYTVMAPQDIEHIKKIQQGLASLKDLAAAKEQVQTQELFCSCYACNPIAPTATDEYLPTDDGQNALSDAKMTTRTMWKFTRRKIISQNLSVRPTTSKSIYYFTGASTITAKKITMHNEFSIKQ